MNFIMSTPGAKIITGILSTLVLATCARDEKTPAATPKAEAPAWQTFTATAYSREGQTASGAMTREGRTVAADPSVLPAGTKIEVADAGEYSGTYIVQDTGPRIKGRDIDLFIDNPAEARRFGKKKVRVRVINTR